MGGNCNIYVKCAQFQRSESFRIHVATNAKCKTRKRVCSKKRHHTGHDAWGARVDTRRAGRLLDAAASRSPKLSKRTARRAAPAVAGLQRVRRAEKFARQEAMVSSRALPYAASSWHPQNKGYWGTPNPDSPDLAMAHAATHTMACAESRAKFLAEQIAGLNGMW